MMQSSTYRTILRKVYTAILEANISGRDMQELASELKRGEFPHELAYMLEQVSRHFRVDSKDEHSEQNRIDLIVKERRLSKTAVRSLIESLGFDTGPSSATLAEIIKKFSSEASRKQISSFLNLSQQDASPDPFLKGIEERRK